MTELAEDQEAMRQSIHKGALTLGIILGAIAALIAYFAAGSFDTLVRLGVTAIVGAAVGYGLYRWRFSAASAAAKCGNCGAVYSISRTDRTEELVGSEEKSETEAKDDGSIELKRWVEDKFDVTDTYTCSNCANVTMKNYQTTRRRDEETLVKPAKVSKTPTGAAADDVPPAAEPVAKAADAAGAKGPSATKRASKLGRASSGQD